MGGRRKRELGLSLLLAVVLAETPLGGTWLAAGRSRKAPIVRVSKVTRGQQGWRGAVVITPTALEAPRSRTRAGGRRFPRILPTYIKSRH